MHLNSIIFAIISVLSFSSPSSSATNCPAGVRTLVPSGAFPGNADDFPLREANLQIFTSHRIPCHGCLTAWRFITANRLTYGLHLAIFRKTASANFKFINETSYKVLVTPANKPDGSWTYHPLKHAIKVQSGDFVGLYYDDFRTSNTIASKTIKAAGESTPITYIYLKEAMNIKISDIVDAEKAFKVYRSPALMATVTCDPLSEISDHRVHLSVKENGATECTARLLNTTLKTFASADECSRFAGDNTKQCGDAFFTFAACVDAKADCSRIQASAQPHIHDGLSCAFAMPYPRKELRSNFAEFNDVLQTETHRSASFCYAVIDANYHTCAHVSGDGNLFCAPFARTALPCYATTLFCESNLPELLKTWRAAKNSSLPIYNNVIKK